MEQQEIFERIGELLDCDAEALKEDTALDEIGWDSMGMLGVIAAARANGRLVTGEQVRQFKTVGDIVRMAF